MTTARYGLYSRQEVQLQKCVVAGERDRPDVARRGAQWIKYQDRVDPSLVFIDESRTRTNVAPLRGWAPRGSCLIGKVPEAAGES